MQQMKFAEFMKSDAKETLFLPVHPYFALDKKDRALWVSRSFEYLIGWNSAYTIDAKHKGNITRFINHSYEPNLEPLGVFSRGVMHIILRTKKWIKKGQQITYDYGPQYWKKREKPI